MGNICSVCAKKNTYVDKRHKPDQDADNKHGYQVATNQGGVLERENQSDDRTTFKSASSSVPKPTDGEKSTPKNGEAANLKQGSSRTAKAKKKKKQPLTDSSESDSSDSDGIGHQGSSHRAYKNHKGGKIMISKKVDVAGNYMNIGHGAKNVVVNMDSPQPKVKPSKPELLLAEGEALRETSFADPPIFLGDLRVQKTRYEPYDRKAWGDHARFVYLREASGGRVEGIDVVSLLGIWEKSICRIEYPEGSGSGFRVGTGNKPLLCTAYHVAVAMVRPGPDPSIFDSGDNESRLARKSVWCVFNHIQEKSNVTERDKFYFEPVCHFFDPVTDIAILELKPNEKGTEMPPAFTNFGVPNIPEVCLHLIGHPEGGKKRWCKSENIINILSPETSEHITFMRDWHEKKKILNFESGQNDKIDNPSRLLFNVTDSFTKGASGCPGLVVVPPSSVYVVTVLLGGYPAWFYDPEIPLEKKAKLPEGFRVEQGANMESVCHNMKRDNQKLCKEIFNQ